MKTNGFNIVQRTAEKDWEARVYLADSDTGEDSCISRYYKSRTDAEEWICKKLKDSEIDNFEVSQKK